MKHREGAPGLGGLSVRGTDQATRPRGSKEYITMEICPTCGQTIPPRFQITGRVSRRLVEIVVKRRDGITRGELTALLYAEDPNGGPQSENIVSVLIHNINEQLAPQGYRIRGIRGGPGSRYYLEPLNGDTISEPARHLHPRRMEGP